MRRARRGRDHGPLLFPPAGGAAAAFAPRVVAGVDEAGYGPLLGPLTIGAVALRVPDGATDPWSALAPVVGRAEERDPARLAVGDSKAVFERTPRGAARLERTALCFAAQAAGRGGALAADGRAFLEATPLPLRSPELAREPWYAALPARLAAPAEALEPVCGELAGALERAGIAVLAADVRALPAGELNASFERTQSKGATHWEQCAPFFRALWERHAAEGLDLVVDRHGGRMRYGEPLRATFPRAAIEALEERAARSVYLVTDADGRRARVTFAEKADGASFAVALASCLAKYARELCMAAFNAHFGALQPGLAPTAGYVTDARRWLAEAAVALARGGSCAEELVRRR